MVEVVGGFSDWVKCEDGSEQYMIFMGIMEKLEELAAKSFSMFQPLDYQIQVVAGQNIKVRIKVSEEEIVHVNIFVPLPHTGLQVEIKEWKGGHTLESNWDVSPTQPQGQSISGLVNQAEVEQIMNMGYSKSVAEKALFLTQSKGVQKAFDWIDVHMDDPDFEEALMIVSSTGPIKQKSNLTEQEKFELGKKMQEQARANMAAREAKQAKETEDARIKNDKILLEIKRKEDEGKFKKEIEEKMREKKAAQERMDAERKKYEAEMKARFGPNWTPQNTSGQAKQAVPPIQVVENSIKLVQTLYKEDVQPGVAKNCLRTCQTFINNVIKEPQNEKFRKVNLQNEKIQTLVGKIQGGLQILKAVGFKQADDGSCLTLEDPIDQNLFKEAAAKLQWALQ